MCIRDSLPRGDIQKIKSNFALHKVNQNHNYTSFQSSFKPLHFCKKGRLMDAPEEFKIYKASKTQGDQLLNDKLSFMSNRLYDTAICVLEQHIDRGRYSATRIG